MHHRSSLALVAALSLVTGVIGGVAGGALVPFYLGSSDRAWLARTWPAVSSLTPPSSWSMDDGTMDVVKRASPAVVSIIVSRGVVAEEESSDLFDPFSDRRGMPDASSSREMADRSPFVPEPLPVGAGTGFFVSSSGLIVTNRHVVQDKTARYRVVLQDGRRLPANVIAVDPTMDLAFIQVSSSQSEPYPVIALGDSDAIGVGQTVIAIGNALAEFQNSVTKGVISGVHRRLVAGTRGAGSEVIEEAIQTDAAINPGNSGGPLLNLQGEVIGVNTAVSEEAQSLGFALPIQAVQRNILSLERYGRIVRPWLGVRYVHVKPELAEERELDRPYGALIVSSRSAVDPAIVPSSPADKAGLQEGDLIIEVQGQRVDEEHPLASTLSRFMPQDQVRVRIIRDHQEQEVIVTLEERRTDL